MVKAKSVKKDPRASKLQKTAAARLADDDDVDEAGPAEPRSQPQTQKQQRASQGGSRSRGSWKAASNVAADLLPHVKRAFIQVFMARECLPQDAPAPDATKQYDQWAKQVYQELSGAADDSGFADFLADCNANLAMLEFQIRRILFPATNTWYVALVNLSADEPSKMLTHKYSIAEVAYFRSLVEAIAMSEDSGVDGVPHIKATEALNLDVDLPTGTEAAGMTQASQASQASQARRQLSMEAKQKALLQLTEAAWMARSPTRKGYGIIGPRTFMALGTWLMSMDLPEKTRAAWQKLM